MPITCARIAEWPTNDVTFGPSGSVAEVVQVVLERLPVLALLEQRADGVVGDGLDPAEHVREVLGRPRRESERAAPDETVVTP